MCREMEERLEHAVGRVERMIVGFPSLTHEEKSSFTAAFWRWSEGYQAGVVTIAFLSEVIARIEDAMSTTGAVAFTDEDGALPKLE